MKIKIKSRKKSNFRDEGIFIEIYNDDKKSCRFIPIKRMQGKFVDRDLFIIQHHINAIFTDLTEFNDEN